MTTREEALDIAAEIRRLLVSNFGDMPTHDARSSAISEIYRLMVAIEAALSPPPDEVMEALDRIENGAIKYVSHFVEDVVQVKRDAGLIRNHIQGRGE